MLGTSFFRRRLRGQAEREPLSSSERSKLSLPRTHSGRVPGATLLPHQVFLQSFPFRTIHSPWHTATCGGAVTVFAVEVLRWTRCEECVWSRREIGERSAQDE